MDAEGIGGAVCERTPVQSGQVQHNTYVRLLRGLEAKNAERLQWILREVFNNQAMLVVVEEPRPDSNTAAYTLIETLRGCDCLHFIDEE